ncbi:MAG: hypothetical protein RRC34_12850 [Lentisphaeria bacterium]|nr:hypothetical protein [Lentisphaeria bacterium]
MRHQPIFTDFPHLFGIMCAPSSSVRVGDWKLIRYFHAGKDAGGHAYELFDLKRDPYESIDLSNFLPAKVKELDALIETHLMETQALVPLRNPQFKGDPRSPRWQKKEPGRPRNLSLETNTIHIQTAGSRRFQLLDQDNKPRQTHALVLEGAEWVSTKSNPDGSIEVIYENPEKNATATVLLGWKGGATCFEINDWTIPPCKLVFNPKKM